MKLKPLKNNIIFSFCDDSIFDKFLNKSGGLIAIADGSGSQTGITRWGKVLAIGEEVQNVKVSEYICIEPGMWTTSLKFENAKYWKTDESKVLMKDDVPHYHEF